MPPMNPTRGLPVAATTKVLLVEDSKFLRMTNERALSKAGYEVSTTADGKEALQLAIEQMPDIILLDMLIPKISGPDVLKALKKDPATMDIPIIVLSSSLSQKNEEKLLSEGAAAYFEKSTLELDKSSNRLAETVETVLARSKKKHASNSQASVSTLAAEPPPCPIAEKLHQQR
jgi:CheY-like chemotaxis protein